MARDGARLRAQAGLTGEISLGELAALFPPAVRTQRACQCVCYGCRFNDCAWCDIGGASCGKG